MTTVALGLDLATAAARLLAVTDEGAVVAERTAALAPVESPAAGHREQRPVYPEVARRLLAAVVADLGPLAARVRALATSGTSGTVVPADAAGAPIGSAVLYSDQRAGAEAAALRSAGRPSTSTSPLARIGWLHRHRPAARYEFTPDTVTADLLGRPAPTDTSHALKAGIDPTGATWDPDALAAVGVDPATLPDLVHPGTVLGEVAPAVARAVGLPAGVAVVAGMTDGCTAQIAAGAVVPGDTVGVLGTTLVWKGVSDVPVTGFDGALYSHLAPDGRWWPGGASNVGAGPVRDEFGGADPGRLAELEALAAAHGPAEAVRYPLRGTGERFPFATPAARGFLLGEVPDESGAYRALLEGVAYVERLGLEALADHGVPVRRHHLAGGASRNTLWNRIRATVLDVPVVRPRRSGSAYGAAVLALAAVTGCGLGEALARTGAGDDPVEPLPGERERLMDGYARLRAELARRGYLGVAAPT
ncbi:FGGY-family carbohydrate kinase [Nocardioides cheoyonin]|uniref:FGGY-family carbohydrate kinase n=1 Tax=Nocardioides cheoyonin TaxID=3156615 RepID=UPI0032B5F702